MTDQRGSSRGEHRSSALWGTGNRGGDSRSNALWGKGGRGLVTALCAVLVVAAPLAAGAGKNGKSTHVDPVLLANARVPNLTVTYDAPVKLSGTVSYTSKHVWPTAAGVKPMWGNRPATGAM